MVIDYAVNRAFAPSVFGSCCDGALLVSPTLLTLVVLHWLSYPAHCYCFRCHNLHNFRLTIDACHVTKAV